jgi:serine/threonine-protein kinase RsbW
MMIAERMRVPDQHKADVSAGQHFHFPAGEASIRLALRQWRQAMQAAEICPDVTARAETVLAEVLNNIAEHGQDEGTVGWIDLYCDMIPSGLQLVVTDQGHPMPPYLLCAPKHNSFAPDDYSLADLPEGGFGWSIIRCLTSDLQHQSHAGGNRLSFVVPYCDKPGQGDPAETNPH